MVESGTRRLRILNVSAQKPDSTGSGTYLAETVAAQAAMGHETAVICGVAADDVIETLPSARVYPVRFETPELPFPVCGMSNEMPYAATRYCDLTPDMVRAFEAAFARTIDKALREFQPDLVLCHHLYLVSTLVRERVDAMGADTAREGEAPANGTRADGTPADKTSAAAAGASAPQVGVVCHSTDLRQMATHSLERERIVSAMRRMDAIFALHGDQAKRISQVYGIPEERIRVIGTGYNSGLFNQKGEQVQRVPGSIVFVGKISFKKGVESLIAALDLIEDWKAGACAETSAGEAAAGTGSGAREATADAGHPDAKVGDEATAGAGRPDAKAGGIRVTLVGGHDPAAADYRRIVERAEACRWPVKLAGRVAPDELVRIYRESDVFVLPSFYEGLPLVGIEAMACGCKVIMTALPGVREGMESLLPQNPLRWVEPPKMASVDTPDATSLPDFERRLARALEEALASPAEPYDTTQASWDGVARRMLEGFEG